MSAKIALRGLTMPSVSYRYLVSILIFVAIASAPQTVRAQSGSQPRPTLPDEQIFATNRFVIHYTLKGEAGVDPSDSNGNNVPDYVDQVAESVEFSWDVEIGQLGWAVPPSDSGEGGDLRFDVYLDNLMPDGIAGYAQSDGGLVRDNPNTPELERRAAYSYLALDNDYAELDESVGESSLDLMHATVAHELNHVIQAGYDDFDPHHWLYEATATWMETQVYPETIDNSLYLYDIYSEPDICRVAEQGWYGSWLFLQLISERFGPDSIRQIWEESRQLEGFDSMDRVMNVYGSSLVQESRDFAIANILHAYQNGANYPSPAFEGDIATGIYSPPDGVMSLGADYIQLIGSGSVDVTLNPIETGSLSGEVVAIRGNEAAVIPLDSLVTINLDTYDAIYTVVHNDEVVGRESKCAYRDYTLTVAQSNQPETAVSLVWPANDYVKPESSGSAVFTAGESEADHSSSYHPPFTGNEHDSSDNAQDLDVGFSYIVPTDLPSGYNFDYSYIMTAEDLGTNADYYMPDGDKTANLDYLNSDGNWLSISQSATAYETVREWMTDIGYTDSPGTFEEVRGLDVLVEDLSTDSETWYSATFITDNLFVVVDGDHSKSEVLDMVAYVIDTGGVQVNAAGTQAAGPEIAATEISSSPPVDANANRNLLMLAGFGLCGVGACIAGIAGVMVLGIMFRRKQA
jgi:hypothetical protein